MYRAVALAADRKGIDPNDAEALSGICRDLDLHFEEGNERPRLFLGREDISSAIRSPHMDLLSSEVSAVRAVREAMTALQRRIGRGHNLVAEGRDMGTVVFPEAEYKFFLSASQAVRTERRYLERLHRGESVSKEEVRRELERRDQQDSSRTLSPLRPAEDAVILDSSRMTIQAVLDEILRRLDR